MKDWIWHSVTGNAASEERTSLTRGLVAAALAECVALIVGALPMGLDMQNHVLMHTSAIVVLLSFVVYGYLDKWLRGRGVKP